MRRRTFVGGAVALLAIGPFLGSGAAARNASRQTAYAFSFQTIDGENLPLAGFAGRALLVVNTASRCGFTHQYAGLQDLHQRFHARGLSVVAVPSNDFGGQEPGTAEQIKSFCTGEYGVTFTLADKESVRGSDAHPFYRWAYRELGPRNAPAWNFHKYLVDKSGRLITAFPSRVAPTSLAVVAAIEAALSAPVAG